MSKILAAMLGQPQHQLISVLQRLEAKAGYPGEDARAIAENLQTTRVKIKSLGLDPDDTTAQELYYSLQSKYASDCQQLEKAAGLDSGAALELRITRAAQLVSHLVISDEVWAVNPSLMKSMLKQYQPRRLMKLLGYRSVDSLLKREDAAAALAVALSIEAPSWRNRQNAKISHLKPGDFELRPARAVVLATKAWAKVPIGKLSLTCPPLGIVAVWPDKEAGNMPMLSMALLILDELQSISLRSHHHHVAVANPVLGWWQGAEHLLAWNEGEPVSLNIKDNALAHMQNLAFEERLTHHASSQLWDSLLSRYKQRIGELPQDVAGLGQAAERKLAPHELALEFEEAEA